MRIPIYFMFAIALLGETPRPEDSVFRAQQLYNAGDIQAAQRELLTLVSRSDAAPYTLATAWSNLGVIYQDMAKAAESERAYVKARTLLENNPVPPEGRDLWLRTVNNLASMYLETGQPGKAERIIETLARQQVPDGDDGARIKGTIASMHMVRERHREAEEMFLALLKYWDKRGMAKESAVILNNLGVLALRRDDWRTAVARLKRSLECWKEALGTDHPTALTASANYGYALLMNGQRGAAEEVLERTYAVAKSSHEDATPLITHIAALYSVALDANGRKKEARRMKDESERMSSAWGPTDPARHTVDIRDLKR